MQTKFDLTNLNFNKVSSEFNDQVKFTGNAFVSFETQQQARLVRKKYKLSSFERCFVCQAEVLPVQKLLAVGKLQAFLVQRQVHFGGQSP